MAFSQLQAIDRPDYGLMLKGFLLWTVVLTVCLLIVGFPVGILIVTAGSFLAMFLHAIMPGMGILLVAGALIASQVIGVLMVAAILTFKGVHPKDVSWLSWLHEKSDLAQEATFAACPLTCDINH